MAHAYQSVDEARVALAKLTAGIGRPERDLVILGEGNTSDSSRRRNLLGQGIRLQFC